MAYILQLYHRDHGRLTHPLFRVLRGYVPPLNLAPLLWCLFRHYISAPPSSPPVSCLLSPFHHELATLYGRLDSVLIVVVVSIYSFRLGPPHPRALHYAALLQQWLFSLSAIFFLSARVKLLDVCPE